MYRLGAGSSYESNNAFGFGIGGGFQVNALVFDLCLNDVYGYEKVYVFPELIFEIVMSDGDIAIRFTSQFWGYNDRMIHRTPTIHYGPVIHQYCVTLVYKDL